MAKGGAKGSTSSGQKTLNSFFTKKQPNSAPTSSDVDEVEEKPKAPAKKSSITANGTVAKRDKKRVSEVEDEVEDNGEASEMVVDEESAAESEPEVVTKKTNGAAKRSVAAAKRKATKKKEESSEEEQADSSHEEVNDVEEDDEDNEPVKKTKTSKKDDQDGKDSYPPINQIPAIFSDLVGRIPKLKLVAEHLQGRKMRVATMCSGTESPLLALELIRRSVLEHHGINVEFEHVFSCEIEPFKQAYIERNFHPPLLFRDVCELGNTHATTAYGSLAPVPGDVDILIAGTSCVDYSNLNNEKQDLEDNGESGRTFRGMMSWVTNHRPPLVILENVCSAPWDRVVQKFEKNKYSAAHLRVDTKNFYIPHTRTRGYLLAVNQKGSDAPNEWVRTINNLRRPASSTLDAFLLPTDDPRIHQARQKLAQSAFNSADRRTGRTDWGRCESRHQRARLEEGLGAKRPLTSWDEGGFCKLPDFAWNDWGVGQVERVWDLMDISLLRSAKLGVDPTYKTQVWNLSQNVDRTISASKPGICPCLTPSMIPFITNRGGPMIGLEALSMQGLPVDELLLTRETEDQLADLAGNAMSTTVVGTCIIVALIVGRKLLKPGNDSRTYEMRNQIEVDEDENLEEVAMDVDKLKISDVPTEERISGLDQLIEKPLKLAATSQTPLDTLLEEAQRSIRLCECEGRKDIIDRQLNRCIDCGSSSCVKCGGRPEHNYQPIDLTANPRVLPSVFERTLKSVLPMALEIQGVTQASLDELREQLESEIPDSRWEAWSGAVVRATKEELRFVEPKRQEIWVATYESDSAYLELLLYPKTPEWRFFAKAEQTEPAKSDLRKRLELPVGRFVCGENLFTGKWDFALPVATTATITIEGSEPIPSWEARLGLQGEGFKDMEVHSRLEISVSEEDLNKFDRNLSGVYMLLDKCGTANGGLHKRESTAEEMDLPPIFMLLDPERCGDPKDDKFVFSISKRRYEYGETRPILGQLNSSWRQSDKEGTQRVKCEVPYTWTMSSEVRLVPAKDKDAAFATPNDNLVLETGEDSCRSANALLVCRAPVQTDANSEWPQGEWKEVDKVHERSTFRSLAWLIERVKSVDDHFAEWQDAEVPHDHTGCERCAPSAPALQWAKGKGRKRAMAFEDPAQAGAFERALKQRPAPFVTQLKLEDGVGTVRIGVNIASLMHRALSRLPTIGRTEKPTVAWRLHTDFTPAAKPSAPKFRLSSNREDDEHEQPPNFKTPLRKEQLRSLTWMIGQESREATPFIEEEISEAILEPLGWRAEGRAQRAIHVRGGVLADEVGYGKTAITLGLIDCMYDDVKKDMRKIRDMKGKIPTKATLIIVPPHLTKQWEKEVHKFTGKKRFSVVNIATVAQLNKVTIEDIQNADIVIIASNIFKSGVYLENLESLAAAGALPSDDGRFFNARLDITIEALSKQVDRLTEKGGAEVMEEIKRAAAEDRDSNIFVPLKRLKGKSYREAAAEAKDTAKPVKKDSKPAKAASSSSKESPKAQPRNGLLMEVVVPAISKRTVSTSSSKATSPPSSVVEDDGDDDAPRPKRSSAKKRTIEISSDEEEEPRPKTNGKAKAKPSKRTSKKSDASSDYEDSDAEQSDEAMSDFIVSSGEEDAPSTKKNTKGKAVAKPRKKVTKKGDSSDVEATTDDAMDVDESEPSSSKAKAKGKAKAKAVNSKKRKSMEPSSDDEAEEKRPAKKKRREDSDPWGLKSVAVRKDWTQMRAPAFEMFHFARTVVDEYTYLEDNSPKVHAMITRLTAERRWVLSGTPPVQDFGSVKTISAFLGVHLGTYDEAEGSSMSYRKAKREQTAVEKFHSFREVHSWEWHAHRNEVGQGFLDRFVRQNIAEIDEIPWTVKKVPVKLPAAERAIYLELEHHLRALDMTVKRGKKSESDREKRLAQALGDSSTAEEALLKRCSHFDLETSDKENAMKACEVIVKERTAQLDNCKKDLLKRFESALKTEKKLGKVPEESLFQEHVRVCRKEGVGDSDATEIVKELLNEAGVPANHAHSKSKDVGLSNSLKEQIWAHREQAHEIRRVTKELVGRVRSLRYFTVVRDLQKQKSKAPVVSCPSCGRDEIAVDEIAVLSSCGHMGCMGCVTQCAEKEECVYAADGVCKAAARVLNIVKGDSLGVDDEARDGKGKHFGRKLEMVVNLIKNEIPEDERILIFVQFPDLMKKLAEALQRSKISFLEIKGTAVQKSKNLDKFQTDSEERVLLLNVMDESASGANLTSANHAIFLSPLLAPTQEIYNACETQAIGRLRRFGQTKLVNIYRFLSTDTIDEEIYAQRTRTKVE
ncbi:hypothetical protein EIP91_005516 [Steccherinum ochraceum]|uniref:Helicase C-terminal domain-containing protein n=1 Tax=Steccherinum ochraceum TaxID=92696 RepID=A0A4R0RS40_9APHY|nr:hypothetical protein EIP91_005516 [Steccherinum ochraceum]